MFFSMGDGPNQTIVDNIPPAVFSREGKNPRMSNLSAGRHGTSGSMLHQLFVGDPDPFSIMLNI